MLCISWESKEVESFYSRDLAVASVERTENVTIVSHIAEIRLSHVSKYRSFRILNIVPL